MINQKKSSNILKLKKGKEKLNGVEADADADSLCYTQVSSTTYFKDNALAFIDSMKTTSHL